VNDLLSLAADLQRRGERFALATVVRCEAPTSAKPGAKALVRADGTVSGWVGGACAEPVVVREALAAIEDGRPRLIGLIGDSAPGPRRAKGPGRTAALHTSTSMSPSAAWACPTMSATAAASPTSTSTECVGTPARPHSAATASSSARLTRALSTRSAPSDAKARAMARPMLRLAPVMRAVLPLSLIRL